MRQVTVAIPASIASDTPHLREKTAKLGSIARSCSIFGVDQIVLYPDDPQTDQGENFNLCEEILRFIETPQYLRKRLFKMSPSLQYAGVLPPLQIPSHNVTKLIRECKPSDWREGVVIARKKNLLFMDVGLEFPLECEGELQVGTRATVELTSIGKESLSGKLIDRQVTGSPLYWGYQVRTQKTSLGEMLEKENFALKIGTSRYGQKLKDAWSKIVIMFNEGSSVMITFGSPKFGLQEILRKEGKTPGDVFDVFVNFVPNQETLTVRAEEAVTITLATLNNMKSMGD